MPAPEARRAVRDAGAKVGRLRSVAGEDGPIILRVGSGHFNLNRATVTVGVEASDSLRARVTLSAAAHEGLIFQDTAAKAIRRILYEITRAAEQ